MWIGSFRAWLKHPFGHAVRGYAHRAAQCLPLGMVAFLLVEVSKRFPLAFFRMGAGRLIDLVLLSTTYLGILR